MKRSLIVCALTWTLMTTVVSSIGCQPSEVGTIGNTPNTAADPSAPVGRAGVAEEAAIDSKASAEAASTDK
jgi:hypothetical protein